MIIRYQLDNLFISDIILSRDNMWTTFTSFWFWTLDDTTFRLCSRVFLLAHRSQLTPLSWG